MLDRKQAMDKEMIGFILADGCLTIVKGKARRKYKDKVYHYLLYTPKVNVTQRVDGEAILDAFKKRFGGYISLNASIARDRPTQKPIKYWVVSNAKICGEIAKMIYECDLPSPKKAVAKILYDYCAWKLPMGSRRMTEEEKVKAEAFWQAIRAANTFKSMPSKVV